VLARNCFLRHLSPQSLRQIIPKATHQAYGLGIYSFFNQGVYITEDNAMTAPDTSGVAVHDAGTVFLNGTGQITHVINGVGTTANQSNGGSLNPVVSYP
jgi:hypothetical protein